MTKKEYADTLLEYQEQMAFCWATHNAIEATKLVKECKAFIKENINNLE